MFGWGGVEIQLSWCCALTLIMSTQCEVEYLCQGRVLVGVGWVIALSASQGDRKATVLPHPGITPLPKTGPRVGTEFTLFELSWVQAEWQDGGCGLSEVIGLCGKSGYLCSLVA